MKKEEFINKIRIFESKLIRFAERILNSSHAEDIVQDTLIKLWTQKEKLKKVDNLEAYSMRITRNLCIDHIKSKKNQFTSEISDYNIQQKSDKTPHDLLESINTIEITKKIIQNLPEQQKQIVHLRDIEGYEFEEIEEITGVKQGAIRAALSRGRKTIREELKNIFSYETR